VTGIITSIAAMRREAEALRARGQRIALAPTMGALHEGHLSLFRVARRRADVLVASIFVNPTQFAENEDFGRYPRNLRRDAALAEQSGCDLLFCPSAAEMYPHMHETTVMTDNLSRILEGEHRPTHFRGVTTVVSILFNIVKPHVAIFGQKDFQQSVILRRMIRDLHFDIEMIVAPTIREADGLAMSSRNAYLDPQQRLAALSINRGLQSARGLYEAGERNPAVLENEVESVILATEGIEIDYVRASNPETLAPSKEGEPCVIVVAARVGATRLIDNILLGAEIEAS